MNPICEHEGNYSMTINQSYFSKFLEKYIINDCPNGAKLQFTVDPIYSTIYNIPVLFITLIKENDNFRLDECDNDMDTFEFIFGVSEKYSKVKEELEKKVWKYSIMNEKLCDLYKDYQINDYNMHLLLLSKFKTFSYIKLIVDNDTLEYLHVYITMKNPTNYFSNVVGFLSLKKLSSDEKGEIKHKNILENIYNFRKLRIVPSEFSICDFKVCNSTSLKDINILYDNYLEVKLRFSESFSQSLKKYPLNINNIEPMIINNQYFWEFKINSQYVSFIGIREISSINSNANIWGIINKYYSMFKKGNKIGMHLDILNGKLSFYKNSKYIGTHPFFFQINNTFNLHFIVRLWRDHI